MPPARTADVVVVADRLTPAMLGWIKRILKRSEPSLNNLIVITRATDLPTPESPALADSRVIIARQSDHPDDVEAINRGLALRSGDVAILAPFSIVSQNWLSELCAVAHSEERTAFAWPLSDEDPGLVRAAPAVETLADADADLAVQHAGGLPRCTTAPAIQGSCVYLRGQNLDAIKLLDSKLPSPADALADWVIRAQGVGFFGKRANHAYVLSPPLAARTECDRFESAPDRFELKAGHANLDHQIARFRDSLDGCLARHALEFLRSGKLRVAYDLRHMPAVNVGTRTYAVELALALAKIPHIELTYLVNEPVQAAGLCGPIMTNQDWRDEFHIVHKPAQFFKRHELAIPFSSSAHVIVTFQDLIAYRVPAVFHTDADFEVYRTTSALSLLCASGILAYSSHARAEIATEFGILIDEIALTPLAVNAEAFSRSVPADRAIRKNLALPGRYFFSLATDYPHKNLRSLLEAYASLRKRWPDRNPPALVLAGYALAARTQIEGGLDSDSRATGVSFLGPVSTDELRILYQDAEALVYPSLYEGFGLPPLEAMAAGTPVIAMPFSSVPEAAGDAALYAEGLLPEELAHSMERVANSPALRAELRARGLARVQQLRWEKTAQATFEAYRNALLSPSERSLQNRRMLREAIMGWSEPTGQSFGLDREEPVPVEQILGVRTAWNALNAAIGRRVEREARRFQLTRGRKRA